MSNNAIKDKLNELKIEDFIWVIYLGIIFMSWYSNSLERKYYLFNDNISKDKYRKIIISIFSILVVVYGYFLYSAFSDVKNINKYKEKKKRELIMSSFIAALLIFISGLIYLSIAILDEDLTVELAFN